MPHDCNGTVLNNGDKVLIRATVTNITSNEEFCNATFVIDMPPGSGMTGDTRLTSNTRICRLDLPVIIGPTEEPPNLATGPAAKPGFAAPTDNQLWRRFMHHPPKGDQATRYSEIRGKVMEAAIYIRDRTPVSPEQTRAFNALDEAMMLANAAIARNED